MNLGRTFWKLRDLARKVWIRIALISTLALVSAAVAPLISWLLPESLRDRIDEVAALALLSILNNSMLTVATFSLSVMVAAHHFASSQVTPRSHRLLRSDGRTQSVISTFIGAFVYALVSDVIINAGFYDGRDFLVVYATTMAVIALVIVALIRWVDQLAGLGSIEKTTGRVDEAATLAMKDRMASPYLGGRPLDREPTGWPVTTHSFGYVRHIDMEALSDLAERLGAEIDVAVQPGDWIGPGDPALHVVGPPVGPEVEEELRDAVLTGDLRSFDQDPIFGLSVMCEIAERALSPGINDPGTAIDVLSRQSRLLHLWDSTSEEPEFPRLHVRPLSAHQAVEVALDPIARDGAAMVEIQLAVQETLARLATHDHPEMREAARWLSRRALDRADQSLLLQEDKDRVRAAAPDD
ncbi:DUF2254 domain-containing protein [Jannaschia rubra]|uniref:DUF2254 domain-containing protein n=1 Tax=Jannaschia rubra TaxID=282197 RepID=UPI00248FA75A|nr:DUF2254 domain-containing protein [Jannaschia rubra]